MSAAQIVQRIGEDGGRVAAPLREAVRPAEIQSDRADCNLRQANPLVDAIVDAEIGRVEWSDPRELDEDAAKTKARPGDHFRAATVPSTEHLPLSPPSTTL